MLFFELYIYTIVFTVWSRTIKSEIPPMIELIEVRAETLYSTWQNKIQKEPDWGHRIRWKNHIQGPEQVEEPYSGHVCNKMEEPIRSILSYKN